MDACSPLGREVVKGTIYSKHGGIGDMAGESDFLSRRAQALVITGIGRDPEDRWVASRDIAAAREKMMDKTLANSYPASHPPSTLPDPSIDSLEWKNP